MILDMMNLEEQALPNFKGGEGVAYARMHVDGLNRIMLVRLPHGASIGMHTHETSSEIIPPYSVFRFAVSLRLLILIVYPVILLSVLS